MGLLQLWNMSILKVLEKIYRWRSDLWYQISRIYFQIGIIWKIGPLKITNYSFLIVNPLKNGVNCKFVKVCMTF